MSVIRADLGTPHLIVCPRCRSGRALQHPIHVITADGVITEPWVLVTCRSCGHLAKAPATQPTKETM